METDINSLIATLGNLNDDACLSAVGDSTQAVLQEAQSSENVLKRSLGQLRRDALLKIQYAMDGSSPELKLTTMRSCLFKRDLDTFRDRESRVHTLKTLMTAVVKFTRVKEFGDETCAVN